MDNILHGVFDMHFHTAPDVVPRKCTDYEAAKRMRASGMAGGVIKSHYMDTSGRAALLREIFPELLIYGGISLNRSVGGLNPEAVRRCGEAGGRMLWFPTMDARAYQTVIHREDPDFDASAFLTVMDENGGLTADTIECLSMAARFHMIVGTGHLSAREGLLLVRYGISLGCRMVLTHCDNPRCFYTPEEEQEGVRMGALAEHSYFTVRHGRTEMEELTERIRAVGCEHVLLDTDFGQLNSPYFDEGLAEFLRQLSEEGFTSEELRRMVRDIPRALLG